MGEYQGVGFHESASIPADLFILNPLRQHLVTGRHNYRYLWSRFGWGGVLLTFFVLFMIGTGMPRVINEVRLATMRTASGEATVVDHHVSHGNSTTYTITYELTIKGQIYSQDESVSRSEYDKWPIGTYVNVTYAVDDPAHHIWAGRGSIGFRSSICLSFLVSCW